MWLCVDRIENDTVILISDEEQIYHLPRAEYVTLVGILPAESAVLAAVVKDGRIVSASYDETETATRMAAARAQLDRLFGRN